MKKKIFDLICSDDGFDFLEDCFTSDKSKKLYLELLKLYFLARVEQGKSVNDISKSVSVTPMTVKRIENLQSIPNISTFFDMLHSVGIDLNFSLIDDNSKGTK